MSQDSTRKPRSRKAAGLPKKPYSEFPLTPHRSGAWQKKILGKVHYFGRWGHVVNGKLVKIESDDPDAWWKPALELYKSKADDLHAGRTPRVKSDGLMVNELCNRFLTAKVRKQDAGELGSRMFQEYRETTDLIVAAFGGDRLVDDLAADDFEQLRAKMAQRWGPVRLGNGITRVKSVFKYALDNALIERPPRYGSEFRKPDKAVLRRHRASNGEKMLEAEQLRTMLKGAAVVGEDGPEIVEPGTQLKAMILLGINAGFGNNDVASLPLSALDLDGGWLYFPRPKTGIARRCPLWPETVAVIRKALAERPAPKDQTDADLVFLMPSGRRWVRVTEKSRTDNVSVQFTNLMLKLGLHREGVGFYTLRHVFRTIADAARDPVAIDLIMGHTDPSMGGHYRERVEDSRLQAVAEHVRAWLFGDPSGNAPKSPPDVTDSSDATNGAESGTQDGEPDSTTDERPALRLYVG